MTAPMIHRTPEGKRIELPSGAVWQALTDAQGRGWLHRVDEPDESAGPFPSLDDAVRALLIRAESDSHGRK